ncbi:MAG: hypothetical protein EPN82_10300 [Bacteroidetes bacterium]|nr:MAG: hypothetical protein EPN82_10300 [Bacteroidota bacterium]
MKKRILSLFIVVSAIICVYSNLYSAEKVYMPFFELINVHADYQYSVARLFKNYVDEQGRYILIIPQRADSLIAQPPLNEIRETAKSNDCSFFIVADMNRIGETVIISVSMYKTENSQLIWKDRLKANTPDDIDPILQKLSRVIGTEHKAAEDGDIYSVTSYESQQLKQIHSISAFGISIGGALLMSNPFIDDPFSGGGGIFWSYDIRTVLFEVDAQSYFLGSYSVGHLSIDVYRPFFAESSTPFLGGGLGFGYTTGASNGQGNGMMLFVGGGYIFGRTADVGLRVRAQYMLGAFKVENTEKSLPHGFMLNMELYFGK